MNSKNLAAFAGLCIAAPAMAQITAIRSDITGNFVNIANNGTATRLSSSTATQDDCGYLFATGVTNAGIGSATYRPNSNGYVQFGGTAATGAGTSSSWANASIPLAGHTVSGAGSSVPQMIAAFWDDQITGATATAANGVWAQTGDATTAFGGISLNGPGGPVAVTGQVTIVQWSGMDLFGLANPQNATYQLMVFANPVVVDGTTVYAIANYLNVIFNTTSGGPGFVRNNGADATLGYSVGASGLGTNVEFGAGNTDIGTTFAHRGGFVANGTSLAFVPTPGAAALLGLGALAAGRRRRA